METKVRIRRRALAFRDSMSGEERDRKSGAIMKKIAGLRWYEEADILLIYVDYRSEVSTKELIKRAFGEGKRVYCPRVEGENMNFYYINSMGELEEGYRGIKEPAGRAERLFSDNIAAGSKCLMLVPGSAFDRERNRIGYGKGYYDRYLERHPNIRTLGVCFEGQMQDGILADRYDRKVGKVVTEEGVY